MCAALVVSRRHQAREDPLQKLKLGNKDNGGLMQFFYEVKITCQRPPERGDVLNAPSSLSKTKAIGICTNNFGFRFILGVWIENEDEFPDTEAFKAVFDQVIRNHRTNAGRNTGAEAKKVVEMCMRYARDENFLNANGQASGGAVLEDAIERMLAPGAASASSSASASEVKSGSRTFFRANGPPSPRASAAPYDPMLTENDEEEPSKRKRRATAEADLDLSAAAMPLPLPLPLPLRDRAPTNAAASINPATLDINMLQALLAQALAAQGKGSVPSSGPEAIATAIGASPA